MQPADALQRAFHLAFCLHPDRDVAACIVEEAYPSLTEVVGRENKRVATQQRRQAARPRRREEASFYRVTLPDAVALQVAVYAVSDRWECDQRQPTPTIPLTYRPTAEDALVRYIKLLVWKTMAWCARDVAVGLGCHLYTYTLRAIQDLDDALATSWSLRSMERTAHWLREEIQERFPGVVLDDTAHLRPPKPEERQVVQQALEALIPWTPAFAPHLPPLHDYDSLRARMVAASEHTDAAERLRIHALIDPTCAGLARMIRAYNDAVERNLGTMPFGDPDEKLGIPETVALSPPSATRFQPAPLSERERARIEHTIGRARQRRQGWHSGRLTVYINGRAYAQLDPHGDFQPLGTIPAKTSYIEVFGDDADGPLLLAVFHVPGTPGAVLDAAQHWEVRQASGPRLTLALQPVATPSGEVATYGLQLAYEAPRQHPLPQQTVAQTLQERLARWWSAPPWHPPLAGHAVTAADTAAQTQVFHFPAGDVHVTCDWWPTGPGQPGMLRLAWQTHLTRPMQVAVRLLRHDRAADDPAALLTELSLGSASEGERLFTADMLGFDPLQVPWALTVGLQEWPT